MGWAGASRRMPAALAWMTAPVMLALGEGGRRNCEESHRRGGGDELFHDRLLPPRLNKLSRSPAATRRNERARE